MSDKPKRWSQARLRVAWVLIAAFVLYPLSAGPATWIVTQWYSPATSDAFAFVYAPLEWAGRSSDLASGAFDRYVQWWADKAAEPTRIPD